ncbi:uncharacterized protein LOC116849483 [Odontomachus brunneus]|uniref:uncharacterized protein LOC116849483 n=1 Tax=Odontomachus brunneus TaxID=486640 RepID=UPI0013F237BF|nr:uncharacterized protein LOC116849483 [Odontomachus brunneus]
MISNESNKTRVTLQDVTNNKMYTLVVTSDEAKRVETVIECIRMKNLNALQCSYKEQTYRMMFVSTCVSCWKVTIVDQALDDKISRFSRPCPIVNDYRDFSNLNRKIDQLSSISFARI